MGAFAVVGVPANHSKDLPQLASPPTTIGEQDVRDILIQESSCARLEACHNNCWRGRQRNGSVGLLSDRLRLRLLRSKDTNHGRSDQGSENCLSQSQCSGAASIQ
jgi:hypothetical protein